MSLGFGSLTLQIYPPDTDMTGNFSTLDIAESVHSLEWVTDITTGQAGKLIVQTIDDGRIAPKEGWHVFCSIDGARIFQGRLFTKEKSGNNNHWTLTAFDKLIYLKNTDTVVFKASRAGDIFRHVCQLAQVPSQVIDMGNYWCPEMIQDQTSYFSMIQHALDLTLINAGQWLVLQDNLTRLEIVDVLRMDTPILIGDNSLATDYTYKSSIEDTFNQIKLTQDNADTNRREVFVVTDSNKINAWGLLQHHESVDERLSPQQVAERANLMMRAKSNPKRDFTVECQGVVDIKAGRSIYVSFSSLASEGLSRISRAIVMKCVHNWSGELHTMSLTLRVV